MFAGFGKDSVPEDAAAAGDAADAEGRFPEESRKSKRMTINQESSICRKEDIFNVLFSFSTFPGKRNMLYWKRKLSGRSGVEMLRKENRENRENKEENESGKRAGRKGRNARLRRCNIGLLFLSASLLMALCVLLLYRVYSLNESMANLTAQAERKERIVREQQEQIRQLQQQIELLQTEALPDEGKDEGPVRQEEGKDVPGEEEPEITAAHKVYLTFDDGPSIYTQDILDILDKYGIKATFFIVGKENDAAKQSMKDIVERGHTLAMHSYTHDYGQIYASVENFAEDFARIQNYIYDVTGTKSTIYRFPGGSSNSVSAMDMAVFARYLDEQGIRFFDWNVSSGDGGSYVFPVETLLENCTSRIQRYDTSVILMHDSAGKKTTIEALPSIIETIQDMEDTVLLPITEDTELVQHIRWQEEEDGTAQ